MLRLASIILSAILLAASISSKGLTAENLVPPDVISTQRLSLPTIAFAPQVNVSRRSLLPAVSTARAPAYVTTTSQTILDTTPGTSRPPSTFKAQVEALTQKKQQQIPVQHPVVEQPDAATPASSTAPTQTTSSSVTPQSQPNGPADTVRFLPIIGAPSEKLQPLSQRMGDSIRASGLTIAPMSDKMADLSLKGYFSVVAQEGEVTVIYVWDVLRTDGVRLHRIQGKESANDKKNSGTDPWNAVTPDIMKTIGQKTVGALMAWIDTQG